MNLFILCNTNRIILKKKPIHDPTHSFSDLPIEIIDQHILKYFDFRDWLRFVIVCKKWLAVARQSVLPKQLVVKESRDVEIACAILSKYTIQTLVLNITSPLDRLERIINASTSVKTLVLHPCTKYRGSAQFKFIHIETLSVGDWSLLKHFPNVTRLKIPIARADLLENNEFPLVQELEIEIIKLLQATNDSGNTLPPKSLLKQYCNW